MDRHREKPEIHGASLNEESSSFLKKRTKKLFPFGTERGPTDWAPMGKVFCFF
jgi:hypothetical protein